jgi:hypothetical protein
MVIFKFSKNNKPLKSSSSRLNSIWTRKKKKFIIYTMSQNGIFQPKKQSKFQRRSFMTREKLTS